MTSHELAEQAFSSATHQKFLSTLILKKYRFYVQATEDISLPGYKGSVFHGGFGHALKAVSPHIFQDLYQPPFKGDPPRPYVLTPPLDSNTTYHTDEMFTFELVLIGPATQHAPICFAAIEKLGGELGLGNGRGKFKLKQIDHLDAMNQPQTRYKNHQWTFADPIVDGYQVSQSSNNNGTTLRLNFTSYLRLKNKGKLVNSAPSFKLLMDRLLGRICSLSKFYGKDECFILQRAEREQLLDMAEHITSSHDNLKWQDWTRYSGRQQTKMKFGGLIGNVQYHGDFSPFMPYLKLGEWLHVGGKTSFGLGGYGMKCKDIRNDKCELE